MRRSPASLALALAVSFALPALAGTPSSLWTGRVAAPRTADVHEDARAVLRRIDATASRVNLVPAGVTQASDGDRFVSFTQQHLGLPVVGAGVTVRLDAQGVATLVSDRTTRTLPTSATPAVSAREARAACTKRTGLAATEAGTKLAFRMVDAEEARLVYSVRLAPRFPHVIAPQALVDAQTGEILELRDLAVRAKAQSYETNPLKSSLALRDLAIAPSSNKLECDVLESFNCVDDKRVESVDFGFGAPTDVHVCSMTKTAVANASGDFVYTPNDVASDPARNADEFSEVTMYYHATKAYAFFRALRGEPNAQVVNDKPLRTVSNLMIPAGVQGGDFSKIGDPNVPLEPFQNAFFSPGGEGDLFSTLYGFTGGSMWFGQGPVHDYSYDGDVVYHEFTHGVVDATLKLGAWTRDAQGASAAPGAMNEGLSDYFAAAISGDPDVGEYASKDIDASMNVIRTLANTDTCPGKVGGQVHHDSTFWSGAVWAARMAVPEANRTAFDRAVYKTMLANPNRSSLGFEEMTELLLATLATDLPAGKTALEASMRARGALPACDRSIAFDGRPVDGPAGLGGYFMAPGRQDLVSFRPVAPGVMTFAYTLPAYTKTVTLSFNVRAGGGGGSPFGGGTPFAPVVFARFDETIAWAKEGSNLVATGATQLTPTKAGSDYTITFDAPEGAKVVYVQVANSGQSSGMYRALTFRSTQGEPPVVPEPEAPVTVASSDGCGCAVAGAPARSSGLFAAGLAALAGLVVRARRRRG
jgi:MYXO-CTERM domain-containing protein